MHAQHIRPHIVARPSVGAPGNVAAIGRPRQHCLHDQSATGGGGKGACRPKATAGDAALRADGGILLTAGDGVLGAVPAVAGTWLEGRSAAPKRSKAI